MKRSGFTLVELLVATAIFATVVVVTINVFIITLRRPLQQISEQHLQNEVNYLFGQLSYQMARATIDYDAYSGRIVNPVTNLQVTIANTAMTISLQNGVVLLTQTDSGNSFPLTTTVSDSVYIDSLNFYIYPTVDSGDPANTTNFQPAIVATLVGHSTVDPNKSFSTQNFITTRTYVR